MAPTRNKDFVSLHEFEELKHAFLALRQQNNSLLRKVNQLEQDLEEMKESMGHVTKRKRSEQQQEQKDDKEESNSGEEGEGEDEDMENSSSGSASISDDESDDEGINLNFIKEKQISISSDTISDTLILKKERLVATANFDKTIKLVSLIDGKVSKTLRRHGDLVVALSKAKIGQTHFLISGSDDCTIKLHKIDKNNNRYEEMAALECGGQVCKLVSFRQRINNQPEHVSFLACSITGGIIEIWNLHDKKKIKQIKGHGDDKFIYSLITFYSDDKSYLVSADVDDKINVWDLDDIINNKSKKRKVPIETLSENEGYYSLYSFEMQSGNVMIAAGGKGKLSLWLKKRNKSFQKYHDFIFDHNGDCVNDIKLFVFDKTFILSTVCAKGWFRCFDVVQKTLIYEVNFQSHQFMSLELSKNEDGNAIFICGGLNQIANTGDLIFLKVGNSIGSTD